MQVLDMWTNLNLTHIQDLFGRFGAAVLYFSMGWYLQMSASVWCFFVVAEILVQTMRLGPDTKNKLSTYSVFISFIWSSNLNNIMIDTSYFV